MNLPAYAAGGIAAAIALPLLLIVFRAMKCLKVDEGSIPAVTKDSYRTLTGIVILLQFPFLAVFGFAVALALNMCAKALITGGRDAVFVIRPEIMTWVCFGFFLGLCLAQMILLLLTKWYLGEERFAGFVYAYNLRYGFHALRVVKILYVSIIIVALLFLPLCLDAYAIFRPTEVVESPLFGLGARHHAYSNVVEVSLIIKHKAPGGNIVDRPHYEASFADRYVWCSENEMGRVNIDLASRIAEYVATACGKSVVTQKMGVCHKW